MAHAFENIGFETAGTAPGLADKWTFVFAVLGDQYASYDVSLPQSFEDFEEEWGNTDSFYEMPDGAVAALYDLTPAQPLEDFEEEWNNEPFYWVFPAGVDATYDIAIPQSFEDFEENWQNNEDDKWEFVLMDLSSAVYDPGGPEAVEDFEEEWGDNEDDIFEFSGGELVAATFDGEDYEDFEEVDLRMHTIEVLAVGADTDRYKITVNATLVEYEATGVGTLDSIRDILVDYVNAAAAGAVASADGAGKMKLRSVFSGDALQVQVATSGDLAEMILLPPPDKTLYWTQTGELDL